MFNNNSKPNSPRRIRVVFEQYALAHYSVPLFTELARHVDLLVVASEGNKVDGLKDITDGAPFKVMRLKQGKSGDLFHPDIIRVLEDFKADIYLSWMFSLDRILSNKISNAKLKSLGVKIMSAGCDGYMYKNPLVGLLRGLINPRMTLKTLKSIVAMSRVHHFLAYSNKTADYFHYARFVPRRKISITGNAIDTSILNQTYHELRNTGQMPITNKIMYAGRLSSGKKPRRLIEAFSKVLQVFPDATLDFVGEGSEREPAEKLANEFGISDKVTFHGSVYDDKQMANLLCRASLYVMPGLGGLGFNSAMACGLPIVYTDADGTERDMLMANNLGWYFNGSVDDLANKIITALKGPQKLQATGKQLEELIMNKYNIPGMIAVYLKAMKALCATNLG